MKKIFFILTFFLALVSCENKESKVVEIQRCEIENKRLIKLTSELQGQIENYHRFEQAFVNEYIINPDSTISAYNEILKNSKQGILTKIVKERISRIKILRKYWKSETGWNITELGTPKKPEIGLTSIRCE